MTNKNRWKPWRHEKSYNTPVVILTLVFHVGAVHYLVVWHVLATILIASHCASQWCGAIGLFFLFSPLVWKKTSLDITPSTLAYRSRPKTTSHTFDTMFSRLSNVITLMRVFGWVWKCDIHTCMVQYDMKYGINLSENIK